MNQNQAGQQMSVCSMRIHVPIRLGKQILLSKQKRKTNTIVVLISVPFVFDPFSPLKPFENNISGPYHSS
jgi:hypothetical protein